MRAGLFSEIEPPVPNSGETRAVDASNHVIPPTAPAKPAAASLNGQNERHYYPQRGQRGLRLTQRGRES